MRFKEYIKQLKEYKNDVFILINYKDEKFVYKNETKYDDLNVTGDGFLKIKEYLDWNVVGVEVFLSDIDEKSNCFVLEMLKMKHMSELKSVQNELKLRREYNEYLDEREKELNQKARQELEEWNEMWDKHKKEQNISMFSFIIFALAIIISFSLGCLED